MVMFLVRPEKADQDAAGCVKRKRKASNVTFIPTSANRKLLGHPS
jgi:hypothetical protein